MKKEESNKKILFSKRRALLWCKQHLSTNLTHLQRVKETSFGIVRTQSSGE